MTTAYITHPRYVEHEMTNYEHPEHPGRIEAVWDVFKAAGLLDRLLLKTPIVATNDVLLRVHDQHHLDILKFISGQDRMVTLGSGDTYALPISEEIARLSAGGCIQAVEAVLDNEADNALAAVRPPGHHATPTTPMGFCLLSNIAIAARHAQAKYDIERVLIVDFDVHHGNGTQDVFYEDNSVLFISTHQHPFYPGTGKLKETGKSEGKGATLNVPLSAGHSDTNYKTIFEHIIWPAAKRFKPELILVSAGFDAHFIDPLAMMGLSLVGYAHLSRELIRMAAELCGGKIVFIMEGGYDLPALSHGMRNVAHALLGEDEISDPYGLNTAKEPDVQPTIAQVQCLHNL